MKKREKGTCAVRRNRAQMDGNGGTWGSGSIHSLAAGWGLKGFQFCAVADRAAKDVGVACV